MKREIDDEARMIFDSFVEDESPNDFTDYSGYNSDRWMKFFRYSFE